MCLLNIFVFYLFENKRQNNMAINIEMAMRTPFERIQ